MSHTQVTPRNRINPLSVPTVEPTTYNDVTLCTEPNCPVCRAQRGERTHKHHKKHRHHHTKHRRTNFWNKLLPRTKSASSTISVHSIELNDRYSPYYSYANERSVVPVNQTERQIITTARSKRITDDEVIREAWATNPSNDDEVVCCRAYNGCRCPCWCCIILIILFVILLIILIVLLATLI